VYESPNISRPRTRSAARRATKANMCPRGLRNGTDVVLFGRYCAKGRLFSVGTRLSLVLPKAQLRTQRTSWASRKYMISLRDQWHFTQSRAKTHHRPPTSLQHNVGTPCSTRTGVAVSTPKNCAFTGENVPLGIRRFVEIKWSALRVVPALRCGSNPLPSLGARPEPRAGGAERG